MDTRGGSDHGVSGAPSVRVITYWFIQVPSDQVRLWTDVQMDARMNSPTEVRATQDVDLAMNLDPCDLHQRLDLG
jgi:hypothetical protein